MDATNSDQMTNSFRLVDFYQTKLYFSYLFTRDSIVFGLNFIYFRRLKHFYQRTRDCLLVRNNYLLVPQIMAYDLALEHKKSFFLFTFLLIRFVPISHALVYGRCSNWFDNRRMHIKSVQVSYDCFLLFNFYVYGHVKLIFFILLFFLFMHWLFLYI